MIQDVQEKSNPEHSHGKSGSQQDEDTFNQKTGLKFKEENSNTSESRSEIPCRFRNVALEKDGEVQLEQTCEK
jgi:hypothetical protein